MNKKLKYSMIIICSILVLFDIIISIFIWDNYAKKIIIYNVVFFSSVIFILIVIYSISYFKDYIDKKNAINITSPKEYVDTIDLRDAWIESFIVNEGIMYYKNSVDKLKSCNPDAVTIIDSTTESDSATGSSYYMFDIKVIEGKRKGVHSIKIPSDKGVEFIKKNYMFHFISKTPMVLDIKKVKHFVTPNEHNQRMDVLKYDNEDIGYDEDLALFDKMKAKIPVQPIIKKVRRESKKPSEFEEVMDKLSEDGEDEEDEE